MALNVLRGVISVPQQIWNDFRYGILGVIVATIGADEVIAHLRGEQPRLTQVPDWLTQAIIQAAGAGEQAVGGPLFDIFIAAAAGIEGLGAGGSQEADAVQMVKRMLGFGVALPFATAELRIAVKAALGEHAPEGLLKAIEEIPLDLGVNFFLGTILERIFETAVARPLDEAIAERKRPFRLEWPQVRALLRQGHINEAVAQERFAKLGIRDQDMPDLLNLDRSFLSLGDLQQLYLFGLMSENEVTDYADVLGFDETDKARLINLYLKRAETAGGDQLRAVVQAGYIDGHLSERQYRDYLDALNIPPRSIDLEVQAANLAKQWGKAKLSLAEIKSLLQHGSIDGNTALLDLLNLGYNEDDARAILKDWKDSAGAGRAGLNQARVLSYLVNHVITPERAYSLLVDMGVRTDDARFLVEHPGSDGGLYAHPLSEKTIVAAFKDDVITQDEATALLRAIDVAPAEINLQVQTAIKAKAKGPKPKKPPRELTDASILDAVKYGLAAPTWAIRELVTLGWSDANAQLLVQTELTKLTERIPPTWITLT